MLGHSGIESSDILNFPFSQVVGTGGRERRSPEAQGRRGSQSSTPSSCSPFVYFRTCLAQEDAVWLLPSTPHVQATFYSPSPECPARERGELHFTGGGGGFPLTARVPHLSLKEGVARLSLTARIERAPLHRARSASKKGTWLDPPSPWLLQK